MNAGVLRCAALLVVAAGIADGAQARERRSPPSLPALLSETGLYLPGTSVVAPENRPFAPQYPLWSDGAAKTRWVFLPPGTRIDVSDVGAWGFPVGTRFWKEFAFGGKKVETRMLWHAGAGRWVFAAYRWNEDGSDAALVPPEGARAVAELGEGKHHDIPGRDDCLACHDAGPVPVLGFNALQLSDDRDPLAPHAEPLTPDMVTLALLARQQLLAPARPELVNEPPRIEAATPRERAVLGYLAANCGGCHNARGPLASIGLVLAHDPGADLPAVRPSLIDVPGRYRVPGVAPESSRRVAPGVPDHSAVLQRMRSRWPASQMPPLGTVRVDEEALRLVEAWIAEDLARE